MAVAAVMTAFFRSLAALGALGLAAALLFSFLAPVSPLADSLTHFRLHLAWALVVAALLSAALGARRIIAGAAAVLLLVGAVGFRPAWPDVAGEGRGPAEVTVLQLNLLFKNPAHEAVLALIEREKPDVIAFQEVSQSNRRLLAALAEAYPHQALCPFAGVGGVAVLSRFPPVDGAAPGCARGGGLGWLRVATPQGPVTVASLHLHWPYPFRQREQLDRLEPALRGLPGPLVLGGDFNAAPWSHAADRVARAARAPVLGGLRFTFHFSHGGRTLPVGMPIDHVLADAALAPVSIAVSGPVGSDHRAVIARLAWRRVAP